MMSYERCPDCGLRGLWPVLHTSDSSLLCHRCGACWRLGAEGLLRVDVRNCPGCVSRPVCLGGLIRRPLPEGQPWGVPDTSLNDLAAQVNSTAG